MQIPAGHTRVGALHAVPGLIRRLGGQPEAVLRPLNLTEDFLNHPDNVLPITVLGTLLYRGVQETACEHFGLLTGSHAGTEQIGVPGRLMLRFPTVGTALAALVKFFHLHNRAAIVFLRRRGTRAAFGYATLTGSFLGVQELQDSVLALSLNIMRRLLGKEWCPTEVRLMRWRPKRPDVYTAFFGAPCVFDAHRSEMVFPVSTLDLIVQETAGLAWRAGLASPDAAWAGAEPRGMDWIERVRRNALSLILAGNCNQKAVADSLGTSVRTMNRRLQHAGSCYREIVDYSRFETSRMLLRETNMPLASVAGLLEYADLSAFGRAFRRWTGISPAAWRRNDIRRQ